MDLTPKELIPAIVGAVGTVLGAILGAVVPIVWKVLEKRRVTHLSTRRKNLLGRWEGSGEDYYIEDTRHPLYKFSVIMTFHKAEYSVKANATLRAPDLPDDEVNLAGVFYDDTYLQLSYENSEKKQMGVVVLGLSAENDNLKGYYAGFSPRRETVVAGKINLRKVK